ncbi:MAG: hypothetical protein NW218_15730 [Saprospiraceae bacterium]|nr:hypothetical protein [Saprospiraceae bacterium]
MRLLPALLLLLACLGGQVVAAQSPWVRSKAGAYAQLAFQSIPRYGYIYDANGNEKILEQSVTEQALQLYGEYGLSKRTTGIIALPFRSILADQNPAFPSPKPYSSDYFILRPGNITLSIRHQLGTQNLPITLTMRADLPSWASRPETGLRAGFKAFTFMPMLSTGKGYEKAYWFGYGGYALRTNHYSDFALVGFEAGRRLGRFWVIAYSELQLSMKNRTRQESGSFQRTNLYVNNQAYWSLGLKSVVKMHRFWGFILGGAGVVDARLLPNKPQYHLGAYFNWE